MSLPSDTTFVTLEIAGPDVDPATVTRRLGVEPTHTSNPPLRNTDGHAPASPPWGIWVLDTRGRVTGDRLADHLRWLADRVSGGPTIGELVPAGSARLLAQGRPETWKLDVAIDEQERARLGLPLSFVVFVKGDPQVKVGHVSTRDPDGAA